MNASPVNGATFGVLFLLLVVVVLWAAVSAGRDSAKADQVREVDRL